MSGLSTLLAYDEEDEDEKQQPQQHTHVAEKNEQRAHSSSPEALPSSTQPPALSVTQAYSPLTLTETAEGGSEEQKETTSTRPPHAQPTAAAPHNTTHSHSAAPLITPQLHRLITQLPPIPAAILPADPHHVHAYFASLPHHIINLLHKRRTSHSSSLIDQLTALPAFHNPAILPRILNTQRINQHEWLWTEEAGRDEQQVDEDSVDGMKRQAEREQQQREREEEDERRQQEAAVEQKVQTRIGPDTVESATTREVSVVDWRERELRKRREAAMNTAVSLPKATLSTTANVQSNTAAASTDAKRQEAMRRAEEINKRLRKT